MPVREADCLIVGGGIGGAVLALALARRGYRIVVLERERQPHPMRRPEVLASSTLEAFDRLGAGERIRNEAVVALDGLELWQAGGKCLFHLTREEFERAGAQPYSTDPSRTRQILMEKAAAAAVRVERGVEVRRLLVEHGRVVGVETERDQQPAEWRAPLVVGDDGGQSRVRSDLGIPLKTRPFPLDFLSAAGPMLSGQPATGGQAWLDPRGIRDGLVGGVFMPLPGSRSAFVFLLSPAAYTRFSRANPAVFFEAAAQLSPRCAELVQTYRFPEDFTHLQRPFGHAPRYVADGAAVLGDAAHPVTPAGGQGANMSVADAIALADVADQALAARDCSAARLHAYETTRRSANHRSLQFSVRTRQLFTTLQVIPWLALLLPRLLASANRSPATKARFIRAVSQAFASP